MVKRGKSWGYVTDLLAVDCELVVGLVLFLELLELFDGQRDELGLEGAAFVSVGGIAAVAVALRLHALLG